VGTAQAQERHDLREAQSRHQVIDLMTL
jgi:hypothetical protein